jgi:hypothetical protein
LFRKTVTSFFWFSAHVAKGVRRRARRVTRVLYLIRQSTDRLFNTRPVKGTILSEETGEIADERLESALLATGKLIAAELDSAYPNGDIRVRALITGCNEHSTRFLSRVFPASDSD